MNYYHYRDKNGLKIDSIIVLPDWDHALIEIKLGSKEGIENVANNLKKIQSELQTYNKKFSFMMIITATNDHIKEVMIYCSSYNKFNWKQISFRSFQYI